LEQWLYPFDRIWGESNRLLPLDAGKRQLHVLKPDEVHILKGCGYAAAWESPYEVNRNENVGHARELAKPRGRSALGRVTKYALSDEEHARDGEARLRVHPRRPARSKEKGADR
jgi:hypothetical protein